MMWNTAFNDAVDLRHVYIAALDLRSSTHCLPLLVFNSEQIWYRTDTWKKKRYLNVDSWIPITLKTFKEDWTRFKLAGGSSFFRVWIICHPIFDLSPYFWNHHNSVSYKTSFQESFSNILADCFTLFSVPIQCRPSIACMYIYV